MTDYIKILGIPVFKSEHTKYYAKKYLFGVCFRKHKQPRAWFDEFIENDPVKNQYIYLCHTPLGEASIFARTAPFWHKNNLPVLCTKKPHIEIFKLFAPNVPTDYLGYGSLLAPSQIDGNYLDPILAPFELQAINTDDKHFFKQWEKYLSANFSDIVFPKALVSDEARESALKKLKEKKVNLNKYILILKDANSMAKLKGMFWHKLETKLKKLGFDIVYNSTDFSISEAYAIAEKSKALIAVRNGFNDILSEIEIPQFLIYSKPRLHEDLQPNYSMAGFPWAAHAYITEYNILKQKANDIISDIVEKIGKGN